MNKKAAAMKSLEKNKELSLLKLDNYKNEINRITLRKKNGHLVVTRCSVVK